MSGRNPGEAPPTLIDYLPAKSLMIINESHVTIPQLGAMFKGDRSRKENLVEYGFRLPSALDNRPLRFDEFESLMPRTVFVSATPSDYEKTHSSSVIEQVVRPTGLVDPEIEVRPVATQVDDLMSEAKERAALGERILVTTLTKRMSEDLTDYLNDHDIKVRYLHSDIDTVERVEILSDLRKGTFDVLVGINLLREGLDLPEVSLVAILDADKEGFLRSTRSLIQTIGRAARNINGKAILYADRITDSMKRAIDETERRREKQQMFNQLNNIIPKSVQKPINEMIEGVVADPKSRTTSRSRTQGNDVIIDSVVVDLSTEEFKKRVKALEEQMYSLARDLEFEKAGQMRDEIAKLKEAHFGVSTKAA